MRKEKLLCTNRLAKPNSNIRVNVDLTLISIATTKLFTIKIVTAPIILLRYCLVDLCNVNTLEKVRCYAEGSKVNRVQLNVIGWLSKTRMEKLNGT
jgi:hypothetical protein